MKKYSSFKLEKMWILQIILYENILNRIINSNSVTLNRNSCCSLCSVTKLLVEEGGWCVCLPAVRQTQRNAKILYAIVGEQKISKILYQSIENNNFREKINFIIYKLCIGI